MTGCGLSVMRESVNRSQMEVNSCNGYNRFLCVSLGSFNLTKHMLLSRHQNAGQNHDIKIANRCFENVAQFRYL
jgi:hypothetical protein